MKRFHVHVAVRDLQESTRFYSAMFGVAPTVVKPDYAKWMLEDPKLNFAISQRSQTPGVNHLGFRPRALKSWKGFMPICNRRIIRSSLKRASNAATRNRINTG